MIEVIIPTTASAERRESLFDAINSIIDQKGVQAIPRVVVNGKIFDRAIFKALESRQDIKLHYEEEGSLPKAISIGRSLVTAEYFGFLDDDDVLLPNALALKLELFQKHPGTDVVVGNGYIDRLGKDTLLYPSFEDSIKEPLYSLMEGNWLASCGGLFRAESVELNYFVNLPKYFEWTWLAFHLATSGKRLQFINTPTFRVRESIGSLSQEEGNIDAQITVVQKMLVKTDNHYVKSKLKKRLGAAYHMASLMALRRGMNSEAWRYHLRSMNTLRNIGFVTFTRYLLLPFLRLRE